MRISNSNTSKKSPDYYFYKERDYHNLSGSSLHAFQFHTKEALHLRVDYEKPLYKLVLCLSGYSETHQKKHLYSFKSGRALFYKANREAYFSNLRKGERFNLVHLHFSENLVEELNQIYSGLFKEQAIDLPLSAQNLELLNGISRYEQGNSPLSSLHMEKMMLEQLHSFCDLFGRSKYWTGYDGQERDKIHQVKYILDNSNTYLTTASLAKEVGINTFKLKKFFKNETGKTLFEYQSDHHLRKAHALLLETNEPIADISLRCGYQSPGSFSNAFKRKFGLRPLEVRKYRLDKS
ncbi:helix-turn-helix transcriptional regulator [Echinicola soli]|uniref:Helix-turn-helix transcriptional regulator n=1 Tax=Echinicola soli TaxID=2591634 RepID=A0A514CMY1_9BACT|nr:helix-turn-helix transcriptional regulator [Echinicola soli]QDH81179.1 helix-turn-helix transcriptional regulator [Echinicola soli]